MFWEITVDLLCSFIGLLFVEGTSLTPSITLCLMPILTFFLVAKLADTIFPKKAIIVRPICPSKLFSIHFLTYYLHKYIELSIRSSHVHKNGYGSTSIILFMYSMYLRIHLLNTSHILSLKSLIKVVYYFSGFIDCAHVLGGLFSRQHLLHWDIN